MRTLFITVLFLCSTFCKAENSPRFATTGRIITVEQWGNLGSEATVWAVQSEKIVVYEVLGGRELLVREIAIGRKEEEEFRRLTSQIDSKLRGRIFFPRGVYDGISIRISFTHDGSLRDDRVEVENHWHPDFEALLMGISEKMPEELRIRFKEKMSRKGLRDAHPIVSMTIADYYRSTEEEKKPNQALEPTAPSGRGSP